MEYHKLYLILVVTTAASLNKHTVVDGAATSCTYSGARSFVIPETYFRNGQTFTSDYTGFTNIRLVTTIPNINIDVLNYNGQTFSIKNAFDIDRDPLTRSSETIWFEYEMVCDGTTTIWTITVKNENDEVPTVKGGIVSTSFYNDISELSVPGTVPFTFRGKVEDLDPGDSITYSMRMYPSSANGSYPFRMINSIGAGDIQLNGTLDFEQGQRKYVYQVFADDSVGHRLTLLLVINILDGNDLPPKFNRTSYELSINENSYIGTRYKTTPPIAAYDQDVEIRTELVFSLNSGHIVFGTQFFEIDPSTGDIIIKAPIDREKRAVYDIVVMVKERYNSTMSDTANLRITIIDLNDSPPQFVRSQYSVSVAEHSPAGTVLVEVAALDQDENTELTFQIDAYTDIIAIEKTRAGTADIVVKNSNLFDRENISSMTFNAIASDGVSAASTKVTVNLVDINDNSPRFTQSLYTFASVNETVSSGFVIGEVSANDRDSGDNSEIRYRIMSVSNSGSALFAINDKTGVIRVVGDLSAEFYPSYDLRIEARDLGTPARTSSSSVRVFVIDQNTNIPKFHQAYILLQVREDAAVGLTLLQLRAQDPDAGTSLSYSITASWIISTSPVEEYFRVINSSGDILLKKALDRERDERFKFQVSAFDGLFYSDPPVTVEVEVVDVNDNAPVFEKDYTFNVTEGCPTRRLGQVRATDRDKGINAEITYYVDSSEFYINPNSGVLNITSCVDRERISSRTVVVYAQDQGSPSRTGSTIVTINILDINDNKPMFTQPQYILTYPENFIGNITLPQVIDADLPPNDRYRVTMINGDTSIFRLHEGYIQVLKPLDVPPGILQVQLTLGLKVVNTEPYFGPEVPDNTAIVQLDVTSVNTHIPTFTRPKYSLEIQENRESGAAILTLVATDGDGDAILFTFANDTEQLILDTFWLDEKSGSLSLKRTLDAENSTLAGPFVFQVVASDPYGKSSTATVNVTVLDINDNIPVIHLEPEEIRLSEAQPVGFKLPISLSVTDKDTVKNGIVRCEVSPGIFFSINNCSSITLIRQIDYEEITRVDIKITAFDNGLPPLTSVKNLKVSITPENDNYPIFESPEYEFSIAENLPTSVSIGTVRASDADRDNITYYISPNSAKEYFRITANGLLYPVQKLDREAIDEHRFQVVASDGRLNTSVSIRIIILDENDNDPVFKPNVGVYTINEAEPNDRVFQVTAVDNQDIGENAEISYEIVSGNDNDVFKINENTGIVRVAKPEEINYETQKEYNLVIQAKDKGPQSRLATISILVRVADINEYIPEFSQELYTAIISENSLVGTLVTQVTATDLDGTGRISYSIRDDEDFTINNIGVIMTAKIIDGDVNMFRNTTVSACDDEGKCSQAQLSVYLTDVNDNVPSFTDFDRQFNVTEDTPSGTLLVNATAVDVDRNDKLSYWIAGAKSLLFINSSTGEIYVVGSPKASEQELYVVTVYVSDGPHQSSVQLSITIQEANLFAPEFSNFAYHKTTCETDKIGESIMIIEVKDKDKGRDGLVNVTIISGNWNNTFFIKPAPLQVNVFELVNRLPLVHEARPFFELQLEARDLAMYPRYDHSMATITLLSGSSSPPVLQSVVTDDITVSSKALPGDIVYTFVALVKTNEERLSLRFAVHPNNSDYSIDTMTGHLMLANRNPAKNTLLNVSACSQTSSQCVGGELTKLCSSLPVRLNVKDEPTLPQFYPSSYYIGNVTENMPPSSVLTVYANQSTGDPVNITIIYNELYGSLFELENNVIWTTGSLDREYQDAYNLLVIAYGDAGVTTANIHIKVLDVNDEPPVFVFTAFREETTESQTFAGHVITTVSVTDDDFDAKNKQVEYKIEPSENSHLFHLEPKGLTCDVVLNDQLDADMSQNLSISTVVYIINVTAFDPTNTSMSTTTSVQILVKDDNDNTPEFASPVYVFYTDEESVQTTDISLGTVRAVDIDKVDIGQIRYSIAEDTDIIYIDVLYGQVFLNRSIDKEEVSFLSFTAQARDSANHTGNATIRIEIRDRNDNKPIFLNDTFDFNVDEGEDSMRRYILYIRDADYGKNSELTFSKKGLSCEVFNLTSRRTDNHTFELTVSVVKPLDRENERVPHIDPGNLAIYSCLLLAEDSGQPALTADQMLSLNVHDINDNPPRFSTKLYEWAITEVSPLNFTVGTLLASDKDYLAENTQMTYGLLSQEGDLFGLNPLTGEVYLAKRITSSASEIRIHNLQVSVFDPSDPVRLNDTADVRIRILDSNDHAPVFSRIRYLFTLSKVSNTDYVGQVFATDNDTDPWNSHIDYSIQFFTREYPFTVEQDTGIIRTQLQNYEKSATFLFGVAATDRGIPRQRSTAIVEVKIVAFSTSAYNGSVVEGAVYNQTVDIRPPIYAVDTASVTSIVYTLQPQDGLGIFSIDSDTGIITVKTTDPSQIDYEKTTLYELQVIAGDKFGSGVAANLVIHVLDANDNAPQFSQRSYNFSVNENAYNTILGRVTATDIDTNSDIIYRIIGDPGPFVIGADTGVIRVMGGLEYEETSSYQFLVDAIDKQKPELFDQVLVAINVENINDNSPIFSSEFYTFTIAEDKNIGSIVGIVKAGDIENDIVQYRITNVTIESLPFEVNEKTGEIIVSSDLDRERNSQYRFTIEARDSSLSNYTQITVYVSDINDNAPEFSDDEYIGSVTELSPVNAVVMVVFANDADEQKTNNSLISYELVGNGSAYFSITELGVIRVKTRFTRTSLFQNGVITEDDPTIYLMVEASDQGDPSLRTTASLKLTIQDQHEEVPKFENSVYNVDVDEGKPIGTKIITVKAQLVDIVNTGIQISYKLIGSNPSFVMKDSTSGSIYSQTTLDREKESYFLYTVQAVDNQTPPKTGYATVAITIQDVNDHSPEFAYTKLEFSKNEGLYEKVLLTTVYAVDKDSGENAKITYSIISGNEDGHFVLNATSGDLVINGELDYETYQQFHLQIQAIDNGKSPRSNKMDVYVYLNDINDNSPVFDQKYGPYLIKENQYEISVDSFHAKDRDSGYNGEVHYALLDGDPNGDFILKEVNSSAVLSLREYLNYEKIPRYNLTIIAYDLGKPRRTTELRVTVNVEPLYEVFIRDNTTVGDRLPVDVSAGLGDFIYTITDGNQMNHFRINETTGYLFLAKQLEGAGDFQLVVQASDSYTSTAYTVVKVIVEASDPFPRFAKPTYAGYVFENQAPPKEIIDLTTSDEQRGRAVRYSVIEGNDDNKFMLDELSGKLYSNVQFDREVKESYSLKIQAFRVEAVARRDLEGYVEALQARKREKRAVESDTTTVKVTIRDVNDNPPRFLTEEHVGIPDSAVKGDIVAYIRATDPDAGENATIAFGLVQSSTYFTIQTETGAVILKADTVTLSTYELLVEAIDNNGLSSGLRASKLFKLIVTDERSRVSYTAQIPIKDLPSYVDLSANLSKILGKDVRVEKAESFSDTQTNITIYAFVDDDTLMSRQDLLNVLNSHQTELNMYFANLTDVITVTAKPIISSGGGGATDIAFIVMGLVVGAAALFGILLLSLYWRQRVSAEEKGHQGNLIDDTGEGSDTDSGIQELGEQETVANPNEMEMMPEGMPMYNQAMMYQMATPDMSMAMMNPWMNSFQMPMQPGLAEQQM